MSVHQRLVGGSAWRRLIELPLMWAAFVADILGGVTAIVAALRVQAEQLHIRLDRIQVALDR